MPEKRRSGPGVRAGASRDPCDMAKAGLPEAQSPEDGRLASAGKTPETGATLCDGIPLVSTQPSEHGALPSEGNQGDERDAYVTLGRMTGRTRDRLRGASPMATEGP
jgi:hypothetical protein